MPDQPTKPNPFDDLPEPIRAAIPPHLLEEIKHGGRWRLRIEQQPAPHQPTHAEREIAALLRSKAPTPATVRLAIARTTAALLDGEITPAAAKIALYALQVLVSTHRKGGRK
jgi:hypothetical protein